MDEMLSDFFRPSDYRSWWLVKSIKEKNFNSLTWLWHAVVLFLPFFVFLMFAFVHGQKILFRWRWITSLPYGTWTWSNKRLLCVQIKTSHHLNTEKISMEHWAACSFRSSILFQASIFLVSPFTCFKKKKKNKRKLTKPRATDKAKVVSRGDAHSLQEKYEKYSIQYNFPSFLSVCKSISSHT